MVPTTLPRLSGEASVAARGTDLRDDGEQPCQRGTDDHHRQRLAAGGDQHATCRQQRHRNNQHPAFKHIAKRHQNSNPAA